MDNNWLEIVGNLQKESMDWERLFADTRAGGGRCVDLGEVLLGGSPCNDTFGVKNVGGDPPYGEYPGGFIQPGGMMDHGEPPQETIQR